MAAPVAHQTAQVVAHALASVTMVNVNTTEVDYILVLAVYNEHAGTAAATVSSVTSSGVTWALRKRSNGSATGGLELWWAHGTGGLSNYTITINFTGTYDIMCAGVVVVSGCASSVAPFDTNVGLPAALSAPTGTWTPSFTGINTSATDNLLLFLSGDVGSTGTPASGFTSIITQGSGSGSWAARVYIDGRAVTALQSSATFTLGAALTSPFGSASGEAVFDALAGTLPAGGGGTSQARAMVLA